MRRWIWRCSRCARRRISKRSVRPASQPAGNNAPQLDRLTSAARAWRPPPTLSAPPACLTSGPLCAGAGIPKGPRIKLLRALQQPGAEPSTPVKPASLPLQPTTPENPTQEKIMQHLLEQARVKDEKIRKLESAALHGLDRSATSSPTPPITPPQRPSQSSAGGTSQEDFEDQASDHSSLASGRFSPGGGSQQSQQASQEGLSDVWGAAGGWTGADFEAEPPAAEAPRTMASASATSTLLAQGVQGEVVWSGGDETNFRPFGVIAVSASSAARGPADRYFMHKSDVQASGLSASQVKEGQKLTFDVHKRNPLEQETSPEAVLQYVKDHRDAWIEWLRREGLSDVGNDPRRHDTATMQSFRRENFTRALSAGDHAATEACYVAINLCLPSGLAPLPRKAAWTTPGNSSAMSAFGHAAQLDSSWTVGAAPAPAKPTSPVGIGDAGSRSASSSIWGGSTFGGGLWGSGDRSVSDQEPERGNASAAAEGVVAAATPSSPAQAAGPATPGSWAAKAMKPPSSAPGAWGKTAPVSAASAQAVPDLSEAQSFPGLGPASQPNSMASYSRSGMPSMAEIAAAPRPQPAEPPSLLEIANPQKQDKKALKKLRKQQQQAAREAEAEASRKALEAMDSDKVQADVALASLEASALGGSKSGEPKLSRRAQERLQEAEKEQRRQEKEEEQLLKQRIRMAKSKGQSWSKDVLENQRHRSGASRRRMEEGN